MITSDKVLDQISDELLITKKQFGSARDFSLHIEQLALNGKLSYMDAVIGFCEENNIDIESIGPLVNKSLKDKIYIEAEGLNFLRSSSKKRKKTKLPL